ncbi:ketopantoate reductase family protein [Heliomarina baculiformis]|uniref:ketopantoate reductase family protein n=1 Tax=Heliomarina baculiformis TaxID=2872036 RepID=UPI001EE331CC|nr:2-dehydropantoate 2-reductase N-terminal domain-containing protein [Heliomarina baculiformis]
MRVIILGVGAVGGTMAAALAMAGQEVIGIARGAQLDAIRANGLTLHAVDGVHHTEFECVGSPSEIDFRPDDAIVLTVKGQHTEAALAQLVEAGVTTQPIFCAQNGVENERRSLRLFPNVHGITVLLPADYMKPGEVAVFGAPKYAIFDVGRFPGGVDEADENLCETLNKANFVAFPSAEVMASKYGKLLMNLANISGAALGEVEEAKIVRQALQAEGERVLTAAGISWMDVGGNDPRRKGTLKIEDVPGIDRVGSSTTQSLARGAGSVETDFLNGEIAMLGRMYGVPTPLNDWFCQLASRMVRDGIAPGSLDASAVLTELDL